MWRLDAHVYACAHVCICILRWEVAPIHAGGFGKNILHSLQCMVVSCMRVYIRYM